MKVHLGISGFYYADWPGIVYPAGTRSAQFFSEYVKLFDTVELNSPFYHFPSAARFSQWGKKAPPGFTFAVKASRSITHFRKLKDTGSLVADFVTNASTLGDLLGPILFQLPPGLAMDEVLLEDFLAVLPPGFRYTIEFRNPSWFTDNIYSLLHHHNVAFCIYDFERRLSPVVTTSDFTYVRLHGPAQKYVGSYDDETLDFWASNIHEWKASGLDVYFYFDNTFLGSAALNALKLKGLISISSGS
jgi:uncharacterized protein YecE (DUF72 family)